MGKWFDGISYTSPLDQAMRTMDIYTQCHYDESVVILYGRAIDMIMQAALNDPNGSLADWAHDVIAIPGRPRVMDEERLLKEARYASWLLDDGLLLSDAELSEATILNNFVRPVKVN